MEHCVFCGSDYFTYSWADMNIISNHFCSDECERTWFKQFSTRDRAIAALIERLRHDTDIPF